jgi:hypothetical protein
MTLRKNAPAAKRRWLALVALVAICTGALASGVLASLSLANPPTFSFVNDENGADDQPGQKDLNSQAVAVPAPGDLWVSWKWDVTSLSGGNTGDACALFDTNQNSKVNFAICVTIQGNPAVQAPVSPRVYTCGDGKVDRCTSTYTQVTPINSACGTNTDATDPFHSGQKDTQAICHIDLADVGGSGTANLVNTCSYPSQQPTSDPSDCVLVPRDAFLRVTKVASPSTTTVFPFKVWTGATEPTTATFSTTGSGTTSYTAIRSDVTYSVKESVPTSWGITGTPSCLGASGSNGTFSGSTISGIDASPDNLITCTFNDQQQSGTLTVIKVVDNTAGLSKVAGDFHYSLNDGSSATNEVAQVSPGITYTRVAGTTYNVVEAEANTGGYTTTYSSDCTSGTIANGDAKTCTITNTATPASPGIGTTMKWTLNDAVALTSFRTGGSGGTATFRLYKDDGDADTCEPDELVFTDANRAVDNSDGTAATASGYTTTASGTYKWVVAYSGNAYNNSITSTCGSEVTTLP